MLSIIFIFSYLYLEWNIFFLGLEIEITSAVFINNFIYFR